MTWAIICGLRLVRPGARVLHHLPSPAIASRLYALLGGRYHPTAPPGSKPYMNHVPFYAFDLTSDSQLMREGYYDLAVFARGLGALGAAALPTLDLIMRGLTPGGSLLFGGDIVAEDRTVAGEDRVAPDGGAKAQPFASLVIKHFGQSCRVRPGDDISADLVESFGLSLAQMRRVGPDVLFWRQA